MEDAVMVAVRLTSHALDREYEAHLPDKMMVVKGHTPAQYLVFARGK